MQQLGIIAIGSEIQKQINSISVRRQIETVNSHKKQLNAICLVISDRLAAAWALVAWYQNACSLWLVGTIGLKWWASQLRCKTNCEKHGKPVPTIRSAARAIWKMDRIVLFRAWPTWTALWFFDWHRHRHYLIIWHLQSAWIKCRIWCGLMLSFICW